MRPGSCSRPVLPSRLLQPAYHLDPATPHLALGQFLRDGQPILLLVNVGPQDYTGRLKVIADRQWQQLDPANGAAQPLAVDADGCVPLQVAPQRNRVDPGIGRHLSEKD